MKLKTYVLPFESRLKNVSTEESLQQLSEQFDVIWNRLGREYTVDELNELLPDAEAIITTWGSLPRMSEEMLERAGRLRMIGHAAGSVKNRLPKSIFSRGIKVFSANRRFGTAVGEYCLAAVMTLLRQLPRFDASVRQQQWGIPGVKGLELTGNTVGIVSASTMARAFISLLAPFQVNLKIFDPYLSEEEAARLNARKATLEEVMQCQIISLHAPNLPATQGMVTRELLRLVPDEAVFVNASRGSVVDEQALIDELSTGRFSAALDVFTREPLAADSPLRQMDNVLLTPHVAGATVQCHQALLGLIIKDFRRSLNGEPTQYEIDEKKWDIMA